MAKELTDKQKDFVSKVEKSIKDNTFAPENLNTLQLRSINKLIEDGVIKSKPLKEIIQERGKARSDLAKRDTVAKDPIAAAFGYDDSRLPLSLIHISEPTRPY